MDGMNGKTIATAFLILALCAARSPADPPPDFKLFHSGTIDFDKPDAGLIGKLDRFTVQPGPAQQHRILESALSDDLDPPLFWPLADRFRGQFDAGLRARYNGLIARLFPGDGYEPVKSGDGLPFSSDHAWEGNALYTLRCLDFDHDGSVDLVAFSRTHYGPTPGLAFFGRSGSAFRFLFDNAGTIVDLEEKSGRIYLRFVSILFLFDSAHVISTIVFDPASKTCRLDSKLFLAQQTEFPAAAGGSQPVKTTAPALLRTAPVVDDKTPVPADIEYADFHTRTLYGNVAAELQTGSAGFRLTQKGIWSLVAFDGGKKPFRSTLRNEDEPMKEVGGVWELIDRPWQYFLGWMETKDLVLQ
jgi:hypothetical protein